MPPAPASPPVKESPARERLLQTAGALFYAEGVHTVGVDRIVSEANVTRATFYRHFPSKEDLVVAYVQRQDLALRGRASEASSELTEPLEVLGAIIDGVAGQLEGEGFRGCPYINVGVEYPDAKSPVRVAVDAHRAWFRGALVELLTASAHDAPEFAADLLIMLRDGAQVGAYLGDPPQVRAAFVRAAAGVLGA